MDKTKAQAQQQGFLPDESPAENSVSLHARQHQVYCLDRAKYMFGSYRRDGANDPEIYAAAIGLVLSEYPRSVVEYATDPRAGLPSKHDFPPSAKQTQEFCNAEMVRIAAAQKPAPKFSKFEYREAPRHPGSRCNVLVRKESLAYPRVLEVVQSGKLDDRDWKYDDEARGTWLALSVWNGIFSYRTAIGQNWKTPEAP